MKPNSTEEIIEYLSSLKIESKLVQKEDEFSRVIEFKIEDNIYYIEWWINQSYLKFENKFSSPNLPFKFINVNSNSPTTLHDKQLCFYDLVKENRGDFIYSEIPFGSFKIPFNL